MEVVTPYDPDYIEDLKSEIGSENREWDPDIKCWRIRITELKTVKRLLTQNGMPFTEENISPMKTGGNVFKQVLEVIPDDYVTKVYFALAQAVHPDHGGTENQMKELNAAYELRNKN
jgi:hypothetical protein